MLKAGRGVASIPLGRIGLGLVGAIRPELAAENLRGRAVLTVRGLPRKPICDRDEAQRGL